MAKEEEIYFEVIDSYVIHLLPYLIATIIFMILSLFSSLFLSLTLCMLGILVFIIIFFPFFHKNRVIITNEQIHIILPKDQSSIIKWNDFETLSLIIYDYRAPLASPLHGWYNSMSTGYILKFDEHSIELNTEFKFHEKRLIEIIDFITDAAEKKDKQVIVKDKQIE